MSHALQNAQVEWVALMIPDKLVYYVTVISANRVFRFEDLEDAAGFCKLEIADARRIVSGEKNEHYLIKAISTQDERIRETIAKRMKKYILIKLYEPMPLSGKHGLHWVTHLTVTKKELASMVKMGYNIKQVS